MEVLSSRVLLSPRDFDRSRRWYTDVLGLRIYREYGAGGRVTGIVLFLGGGFLELTSAGPPPGEGAASVTLWLQVPTVDAEHDRLSATDEVTIVAPPKTMPWGLREMWIEDPDGVRIVVVEVPEMHPLRRRLE
ncbi:MAG TPA: VOC family protein [Acidimicrobiales bacterium]|jgi:catechol 2,3-dioxygenase-like lactoylglutathione lyase family enzyme|nr:VOC family protein [Acidimicrobiales bacterium]